MSMQRINKRYFLIPLLVLLLLCLMLTGCGQQTATSASNDATSGSSAKAPLLAYVGANLKEPMTELAKNYEEKTGIRIELTFNNSGALLNQLQTVSQGDIYMPGGMPFVKKAKELNLLDKIEGPIAIHTPVIVVPKGNPADIHGLQDLTNAGVQLLIPDKEATAIGKTAYRIFDAAGITAAVEKNLTANMETPAKVIAAISLGQGNAGIVEYSNTLKAGDKLERIDIKPEWNQTEEIPIATLAASQQKTAAEDFIQYVKANGPTVFKKYGFKTK